MFALAELQLWLHAEAEPCSPGTRRGPRVLHLFSRDCSAGMKPAELVQERGTQACSPWHGRTKLLQGGQGKTKPRKDGVWVLADFQGARPPREGPGARKGHGMSLPEASAAHPSNSNSSSDPGHWEAGSRKSHLRPFPYFMPKASFHYCAGPIIWKTARKHHRHRLRSLYCDQDTEMGVCSKTEIHFSRAAPHKGSAGPGWQGTGTLGLGLAPSPDRPLSSGPQPGATQGPALARSSRGAGTDEEGAWVQLGAALGEAGEPRAALML